MGFLSKVGKGIKKGFKKVVGAIGKLASSTFGKVLLAAVVIFTLGTALIAGGAAFASTTGGFAAKFVAGAKAFGAALASPLKAAKGLFNGAGAAGGQAAAGAAAGQATGAAAAGAAETASAAVGAAAPASTPIGVLASGSEAATSAAAASAAATPATGSLATAGSNLAGKAAPGLISKAAGAVGKVVTNPAFVTTVGQAAQGFAAGKAQEEIIKREERERRRIDEEFRDPEKLRQLNEVAARPVNIGQGFIERARNVANFMNNRPGSGPSVQAGNPDDAFGRYVVGY